MSVFSLVADPTRRQLLDAIVEEPCTVNALVERVGLSQPAVSKHLRLLREGGLVKVRRDGQRRWYELAPEPLVEVDQWLEPYRRRWAERLDALETYLEENP